MNAHLFVYGSLLAGARHPMGERLAREARLVGEGSLPGRLYKIDWYPGLVEAAEAGERVYGEVYALCNPVGTLGWLDAYEGVTQAGAEHEDYVRSERPVRLAAGVEISCWVYLYRKHVAGMVLLPSGRWLDGPASACNRPPPRHNS